MHKCIVAVTVMGRRRRKPGEIIRGHGEWKRLGEETKGELRDLRGASGRRVRN